MTSLGGRAVKELSWANPKLGTWDGSGVDNFEIGEALLRLPRNRNPHEFGGKNFFEEVSRFNDSKKSKL